MNSEKKRELYFNRKLWIESIFHERDIIHFLISLQHLFTHTHTIFKFTMIQSIYIEF